MSQWEWEWNGMVIIAFRLGCTWEGVGECSRGRGNCLQGVCGWGWAGRWGHACWARGGHSLLPPPSTGVVCCPKKVAKFNQLGTKSLPQPGNKQLLGGAWELGPGVCVSLSCPRPQGVGSGVWGSTKAHQGGRQTGHWHNVWANKAGMGRRENGPANQVASSAQPPLSN